VEARVDYLDAVLFWLKMIAGLEAARLGLELWRLHPPRAGGRKR